MNNEKKLQYESPSLRVVVFGKQDIITTSGGAFLGEWVSLGGNNKKGYVSLND